MILDPNSEAGQIIEALCGERERLRADLARVTAERDAAAAVAEGRRDRAKRAEAERDGWEGTATRQSEYASQVADERDHMRAVVEAAHLYRVAARLGLSTTREGEALDAALAALDGVK